MINFKKFKDRKELEEYCQELYTATLTFQNRIKSLEEKLKQSEELIKNTPTEISTEQQLRDLLMREIAYMDKLSKVGGLNAEETRQLKLVVDAYVALERKNQQPADTGKKKKLPQDPAKLISIVKNSKPES
jgi:hypothetical protein